MSEWKFAQREESEHLCQLHFFCVTKKSGGHDVEFKITVKEYLTPPDPMMRFLAESEKQTNQSITPFTPVGWGRTLLDALSQCIRSIERFPYQGPI